MAPPTTKPRLVKARQRLRALIDDIRDPSQTWKPHEAADTMESILDVIVDEATPEDTP